MGEVVANYTSFQFKAIVTAGKLCETTEYGCQFLESNDDGEYTCSLFHEDIHSYKKCSDCIQACKE